MLKSGLILLAALFSLAGGPARATGVDYSVLTAVAELVADAEYGAAEARLTEAYLAAADAPYEDRAAYLDELVAVQLADGRPEAAAFTLTVQTRLLAETAGPDAPGLSSIYVRLGAAWSAAGAPGAARDAFAEALRIDSLYLPCGSEALAELYARIAESSEALGDTAAADTALARAGDATLRCAEEGPRRSGEEDNPFVEVTVYYGTDRARTGSARPEDFYGSARADVSYGRAVVSIPEIHRPGRLETPSIFRLEFRNRPEAHVILQSVDALPGDEMWAEIRAGFAGVGEDELFLFVHGFNVTFADAARRTAQMAHDLDFVGAPLFYSWPSRGSAGSYVADTAAVAASARRLSRFLDEVIDNSGAKRIHLLAHSMGNRALLQALETLALRRGRDTPIFEQVIFAAPDVDSDLFGLIVDEIDGIAKRMTLYTSDTDLALRASRKLHGNAPRAGLSRGEALVSEQFDTVDMTDAGADLLRHNYYGNDASALTDILWLFWRDAPPPNRCGMVERPGDAGPFWLFEGGTCDPNIFLSAISLARESGRAAIARVERKLETLAEDETETRDELERVRAALDVVLGE